MRFFALSFVLLACAARVSSTSAPASGPEEVSGADPSGAVAPRSDAPRAATAAARPQKGPAEHILERPELSAYHGWIRYLQFRAAHAKERSSKNPDAVREDEQRLAEWAERITSNPNVLAGLRGVVEWAYLSPVDDSGQPFKMNIPTDYDPTKPAPVSLYMHGYSGNHLEHAAGMKDRAGSFAVSVLGRSRGGGYRALSEADVLHVLDYIAKHWKVDLDRVHLNGGSMGGGGTFWLGSRYPQRFASGRTVCGAASDKPLSNLLTFPIYATHSDDDWTVPVLHSRGPIQKLRALGAKVTLDETTGYGHAVWNYAAGNERADAWYVKQVRPPAHEVKRLDFTALDGGAVRAFWAEVTEWGPAPKPAHFVLEAKAQNQLEARLENITRLTLRLSEAPLDARLPLRVAIDGAPALRLPAPLPISIVLAQGQGGWALEARAPEAPYRLHTPGGTNQLYNGEPLLIVYGTRGDAAVDTALKHAAEVASRSSDATWPKPHGRLGADGIPHNQNLYGELHIKPDVEVTPDDATRRHLVLLGTADQNSVVSRIASKLPVRYGAAKLELGDGEELDAKDLALGLMFYNPEAPSRLGAELTRAVQALASTAARIEPALDLERVKPKREYRLALSAQQITPFALRTQLAPRKYQVTDTTVSQALARFGVAP